MMHKLDDLIGNSHNRDALSRMAKSKKIPQVLLFSGHEGVGKKSFAKALIAELIDTENLCIEKFDSHPDIKEYFPDTKAECYSVATIDNFIEEAAYPPFEAQYRFFLFYQAEQLQPIHANRLLKTLEEMPLNSIVILFAPNKRLLLDTIVSRSMVFNFFPLPLDELAPLIERVMGLSEKESLALAKNSNGSISEALLSEHTKELDHLVLEAHVAFSQSQVDLGIEKLVKIDGFLEVQKEKGVGLKKALFMRVINLSLLWIRDLHLADVTQDAEFYHYQEKIELFKKLKAKKIPSFEDVKKYQYDAIEGFERHVKPKNILQQLMIRIHCLN
ncbi:MAG: hypothetical protein P0S95_01520 [Rhabdochlamydiaceae bacterium]|nr:hypothetical protein [Candidatus Amphrikana amoebophyrae]